MSEEDDAKERREARKERVLHTRVPAVLEQELKRVANAWRVPVSNVVRALLEDALDTLDAVGAKAEDELRGVAEKLAFERHRIRERSTEQRKESQRRREPSPAHEAPPADPLQGAVGVTPIILVHDSVCGLTGEALPAGSEAYMVLFDDPRRQLITGKDALPRASTPNQEEADD
jgi:hypothetical protein